MGDCMALCCSTKHCNIAYMKNNTCYGVTCYDADRCTVRNDTGLNEKGTQLALLIRSEMNRRGKPYCYCLSVLQNNTMFRFSLPFYGLCTFL